MLAALSQLAPSEAVRREPLWGGDLGTAQTIAQIRRLIEQGKRSIAVNRLAIAIVWNTPEFSQTEKARAIFDWARVNTRFIPMIVGVQTLRTAEEILRVRAGDCANVNAVLIPSLLETIGIPARLVTIAGDADAPREFTHVYAEALADGEWIPMDAARPGAQFGLAPQRYFRKRVWDTESAAYRDEKKISGYIGQDFSTDVAALTSGLTNVITASRAAPANLRVSGSPYASVGAAQTAAESLPSIFSSAGGLGFLGIPTWVWLLVIAGGAVAIFGAARSR